VFAALALGAIPLGLCHLVWRRMERVRLLPLRPAYWMLSGGCLTGALAAYVEPLALDWMELSFQVSTVGAGPALSAMLLMAAPLEEALKALVVWPLYVRRQLVSARLGLTFAMCAGAGFAAGEAALLALSGPITPLAAVRILALGPAHLFFAGLWGFALGAGRRGRDRWFPLAWSAAVLLHGLYDHLMLGRGPALLLVLVPLLLFMFGAAWIVLRSLAPESDSSDASSKLSLLSPPSLSDMRRAMQRPERPLMLHWIALGALVTLGVVLASLAGAVYLGHRLGIDFTLANESELMASGPLVLLGSAVLLAFPLSGYLIARASSAESVLEPALASGAAIAFVMLMLSVTEPVALVVAVVIAPLAFSLACGGAWFGLDRP
jgi:hypothetical protein